MRYDFPSEWYAFLNPSAAAGGEQLLSFTVGLERLQFFVQRRDVAIGKVEVFSKGAKGETYDAADAGLDPEEMDITKPLSLKLKRNTAWDYTRLGTDELEDILMVFHYKLGA